MGLSPASALLRSDLGPATYTYVPLLPSSIIRRKLGSKPPLKVRPYDSIEMCVLLLVTQNPIQRNVRTALLSVLMTVHNISTQYSTKQNVGTLMPRDPVVFQMFYTSVAEEA